MDLRHASVIIVLTCFAIALDRWSLCVSIHGRDGHRVGSIRDQVVEESVVDTSRNQDLEGEETELSKTDGYLHHGSHASSERLLAESRNMTTQLLIIPYPVNLITSHCMTCSRPLIQNDFQLWNYSYEICWSSPPNWGTEGQTPNQSLRWTVDVSNSWDYQVCSAGLCTVCRT